MKASTDSMRVLYVAREQYEKIQSTTADLRTSRDLEGRKTSSEEA